MKLAGLIKIADKLDSAGFSKEADYIDALISKAASNAAVYNFVEDLIATFKSVALQQKVLPGINKESLPDILQVIHAVLKQGNYESQEIGIDTMKEIESDVYRIGAGILALEADLPKIQRAINDETNELEKRSLQMEEKKINEKLHKLHEEVRQLKEGKREEDKYMYEQLKSYLHNRGKEI